ncbi:MAG: hypothetical protein AAFV62_05540 [Pseudomonadota bacterium]
MTRSPLSTTEAEPGDALPEDPRFAAMRRLVTLLLWVLIIGTVAVVLTLVWKLKQLPVNAVTGLRPGERLVEAVATADRVTLRLEDGASGEQRVIVLDGASFLPMAEISAQESAAERGAATSPGPE